MIEKTFYQILLSYSLNPKQAKTGLLDKRLSRMEKCILEAYLNVRDNDNKLAVDLLEPLSPSASPFVEAQRNLMIGCAYTNLGNFEKAEFYLNTAITLFESLPYPYFLFYSYNSLFWNCSNSNDFAGMEKCLLKMRAIPSGEQIQEIRTLRAELSFYQLKQENDKAASIIGKLELLKESLSESDSIFYLVDKFMLYIQMDEFDLCYQALDEMKKFRKYHLTENWRFMKKLLDHYVHGSPIYCYEREMENIPFLYHQLKVIECLENANKEEASFHWAQLRSFDSKTFGDSFHYHGPKCIFSMCLDKHSPLSEKVLNFELESGASRLDKAAALFMASTGPLNSAEVFEIIWGVEVQTKEDLRRLSRLVSDLRCLRKMDIVFSKGTYHYKRSITRPKLKLKA